MFIAASYAFIGLLWIIFSDLVLSEVTNKWSDLLFYAQLKGVAFVLVTAAILYLLVRKHYDIIIERQNDLKLLFDHGGLGLIKLSADGSIEFISKGLSDTLGYEEGELIGQSVKDITYPDDIPFDEEIVAQLESGHITNYTFEKRYLKKGTKESIWVTLNGTVQRKQGKIVRYITAIQDLTPIVEEQQRAKLEIREKRALINSTRDIVWSVDKEGNLVSFNDAFEELIKTFQGKMVKRGDPGAIEASDDFELTKRWKGYYQKAGTKGRYNMVEQIILNDELKSFEITFYPIVEEKQVIGVSCFGRDITKLMQTQHDLKRTLQRLEETTRFTQLALNRLPIGVAVNEIESGKMTFVNDQFMRIYGWSLGEVSDVESFFERVYPDPDYRKEIQEQIMADMASEDPERMQWDGIKIATSDGTERYINAKNIPVYEQNLMISTVIDVTLEYKHISTIENQNERLKKIAWQQSHMVRSKLTNVISLISLIREDANKGLQSLTMLERLDQATKEFDMAVREVAELGSHNNIRKNQ